MGPGGRAMTCGGWPGAAAADPHDAGRSAVARSVPAPGSPNSPTMCRSAGRAVAGRPRGAAVPGCPAPSHRRRRHAAEPLRHQHRWHARRSPPCKCATGRRSGRGPHPRHQRAQPSPPRRQAESNLARKRPDRPPPAHLGADTRTDRLCPAPGAPPFAVATVLHPRSPGHHRILRLARHWPWSELITDALDRLQSPSNPRLTSTFPALRAAPPQRSHRTPRILTNSQYKGAFGNLAAPLNPRCRGQGIRTKACIEP